MMEGLLNYAAGTFLALMPIANPIGAVPIFYSLTDGDSQPYRRKQARLTSINVFWVLALFLIAGKLILSFFGISLGVLKIAGGLLVAHTAWEMVTARPRLTAKENSEATDKEDISFAPMAVPMVSGPGAIGVVIGLSAKTSFWLDYLGCLLGIALLGGTLYFCLLLGEPLTKALGATGVGALNRLLGFLILAIAVQFIADGAFQLLQEVAPSLFNHAAILSTP
jgi:multiple antibiotic resistance protein